MDLFLAAEFLENALLSYGWPHEIDFKMLSALVLPSFPLTLLLLSEKGLRGVPAEAVIPVTPPPIRRLDNLFFIEEPKNVSVPESKWTHCSPQVHVDQEERDHFSCIIRRAEKETLHLN